MVRNPKNLFLDSSLVKEIFSVELRDYFVSKDELEFVVSNLTFDKLWFQ